MSDFRAIATVTAVIRDLLEEVQIDMKSIPHSPIIKVKTVTPDALKTANEDALNLFLYQVTPNTAYRNDDLPSRASDGSLIKKPQFAVDLHYLVTAYAAHNNELKAQMMLASAITILHDNALITKDRITATVDNLTNNSENEVLAGSNLADQPEAIKLTPRALSIEDLTKLWTSFFQTSYRISVAYTATVVLLESKLKPKPAFPVSKRLIRVSPIKQPIIDSVDPQTLEYAPGAKLTVTGRNLLGDKVVVQIDQTQVPVPSADASEQRVTISLPVGLTAGIKQVKVLNLFVFQPGDQGHKGYESNVAAFVLSPKITRVAPNIVAHRDTLTINVEPGVAEGQTVTVLVGDFVLPVELPSAASTAYPLKTISVTIPSYVALGAYPVRLRVDGADSVPATDGSQTIQVGP
jgi:hypothetical protein